MLRLALLLAVLPAMATALPDQLLRQIEQGLRAHRIEADVGKLTNAQAVALHFELTSPDSPGTIRMRLLNILRKGEDF